MEYGPVILLGVGQILAGFMAGYAYASRERWYGILLLIMAIALTVSLVFSSMTAALIHLMAQ